MNYRFKQSIFELSKTEYIQEDWYYKVYTNYGACCFLKRAEAFNFYKHNNGYRISKIDKGDSKNETIIVDEKGLDIERIREDFSIKKTNKSTRKAIQKYDKENTTKICLKLNKNTDADIIEFLSMQENKNGFIKELILKEINRNKNEYSHIYEKHNEIRAIA